MMIHPYTRTASVFSTFPTYYYKSINHLCHRMESIDLRNLVPMDIHEPMDWEEEESSMLFPEPMDWEPIPEPMDWDESL